MTDGNQPVDLAFTSAGPEDGLAVVLLHGFPFDRTMWEPQVATLSQAGYRVIAPDLRGLGKSPRGPGGQAGMDAMAKDVARLVVGLGVGRFALAGFSMGGYVALELLRTQRDAVLGLALVDSRAEPDSMDARHARLETAGSLKRKGMPLMVETMLPKLLSARTREERPDLVERVERLILAQPKLGAADALQGMAERADTRGLLPEAKVPALVVVGAEDPITPPETAREMVAALPDARLVTVEGAAHLTPLERPDEVGAALLDWLGRVRPAPRKL